MIAKFLAVLPVILISLSVNATTDVTTSILDRGKTLPRLEKTGQFGLGLQAGIHSGVTVAYWAAESRVLDLTFTAQHRNAVVGLAHLWMFRGAFPGDFTPLTPYLGAGLMGVAGTSQDLFERRTSQAPLVTAIQIPLGFEFLVRRWGLFAEAVPVIEISPYSKDVILADGGARYYF